MASTAHSSSSGDQSLLSTWNFKKRRANVPSRIGMFGIEAILVAVAMFLLPTFIQSLVHGFDEAYEVLGRRARSPYKTISWSSVLVSIFCMVCWHAWLGRLSYKTIVEEDSNSTSYETRRRTNQGGGASWGRILGRIVLPFFLVAFAFQFAFHVLQRYISPAPLVTANTVNIKDD